MISINHELPVEAHRLPERQEDEVLDTILLAAGVVGLLLTVAYAYACERM